MPQVEKQELIRGMLLQVVDNFGDDSMNYPCRIVPYEGVHQGLSEVFPIGVNLA